jgi:hypothetical protein
MRILAQIQGGDARSPVNLRNLRMAGDPKGLPDKARSWLAEAAGKRAALVAEETFRV